MKTITFNFSLGETLMERLLEAYQRGHGIHRFKPETHAPQHLSIPEGIKRGGKEWRRWLARAAGTDYRTQSMHHYAAHARLQEKHPPLYTHEAAGYMPIMVGLILKEEGFSKWETMSTQLPVLADTFAREFQDDPLNLYRGGSIDSVLEFKNRFRREHGYEGIPGFGPKISSLFAVFLEEAGLVQVDDALPVDVWVQQIFIATGIITLLGEARNETLENEIRLFLCDLCARRSWNRIELAHALWFLGNRGCKECHRFPDMEVACVLWCNCRGKAASDSYRLRGLWTPENPLYRKGGSRVFKLEPVPADSMQQALFPEE